MMFWEAQRHLPLTSPLEHLGPVVSAAFSFDGEGFPPRGGH
jgi:hypothetical protein